MTCRDNFSESMRLNLRNCVVAGLVVGFALLKMDEHAAWFTYPYSPRVGGGVQLFQDVHGDGLPVREDLGEVLGAEGRPQRG